MQRNLRQRVTAGLLALLAQAGLIAWLTLSGVNEVEQAADSPYLIFIPPLQGPEVAPSRTRARVNNPVTRPVLIPDSDPQPAEPNRAITLSPKSDPPIDWYRDIEKAARSAAAKVEELALQGELLDSKPRVLDLPAEREDELAPVTATRLDNSDLVTRHRVTEDLTVICVHEHIPLIRHFDIGVRQRAPDCYKKRDPIRDSLFEAIKPGYLRKPLPTPDSPQTRDRR